MKIYKSDVTDNESENKYGMLELRLDVSTAAGTGSRAASFHIHPKDDIEDILGHIAYEIYMGQAEHSINKSPDKWSEKDPTMTIDVKANE